MKLLALDTATEACSAALLVDGKLFERYEETPRAHSKRILPMIDELLKEANVKRGELDAIAFGRGPGSFVGARIGAGVTQGISLTLELPVIPVSSLAAIAQRCYRETGAKRIVAAIDARMKEVYWGAYELNDEGIMTLQAEEIVAGPDQITLPKGNEWVGAGSGWEAYPDILQQRMGKQLSHSVGFLLPRAIDVAMIGQALFQRGETVTPEQALPVYLRNNVAKKPKHLL